MFETTLLRTIRCAMAALLLSASAFLFACSAGEPPSSDASPSDSATVEAVLSVQVDVVGGSGESIFSGAVSLPVGATALDALQATGLDCVVEESQYGAFVSEIDGIANGQASAAAGWTYALNGDMPMESCDELELSDGDVLTWEYAEFE